MSQVLRRSSLEALKYSLGDTKCLQHSNHVYCGKSANEGDID